MNKQKRINWIKDRISSMEQCRDEMPFGLSEDESMELSAYKDSFASLTAEPRQWVVHARVGDQFTTDSDYVANAEGMHGLRATPLFTAPPVPEIKLPDRDKLPGWARNHEDSLDWYESEIKRLNGLGDNS